jgi:hypothetical protein
MQFCERPWHQMLMHLNEVADRIVGVDTLKVIDDISDRRLRAAEVSDRGAPAQYNLSVSFGISGEGIAIQPDSTVTRIRSIGSANWTLIALDPGQTRLTSGCARAVDGLNLFDAQYFAADLENESVTRRLAKEVADQITLQLAAFFRKRAATSS